MNEAQLSVERTLPAPPEEVFAALTQPQHLLSWWGVTAEHRTSIAEVDLRVGGTYRLGMLAPSGTEYIVAGVFREISPPQRLVYTWAWEHEAAKSSHDGSPAASVVTIDLRPEGARTHLVLTHERLADQPSADGHRGGWEGCLDNLSRHLDGV